MRMYITYFPQDHLDTEQNLAVIIISRGRVPKHICKTAIGNLFWTQTSFSEDNQPDRNTVQPPSTAGRTSGRPFNYSQIKWR